MKQISEYILESQKPTDYKDKVKEVIDAGKEKNLKVVFRDKTMNSGDFCFFIYDKKKQERYLVGYDGDWSAKESDPTNFYNCVQSSLKYIKEYK